jgi:hypothetical protein
MKAVASLTVSIVLLVAALASADDQFPGFKVDPGFPKEMDISAKQPWVGTGISVAKGRRIVVEAAGSWSAHPSLSGSYGPDGWVGHKAQADYAIPGATEGALVGRIAGQTFQVGKKAFIDVQNPGELQLSINDDVPHKHGSGFKDNSGSMHVTITVLEPL